MNLIMGHNSTCSLWEAHTWCFYEIRAEEACGAQVYTTYCFLYASEVSSLWILKSKNLDLDFRRRILAGSYKMENCHQHLFQE